MDFRSKLSVPVEMMGILTNRVAISFVQFCSCFIAGKVLKVKSCNRLKGNAENIEMSSSLLTSDFWWYEDWNTVQIDINLYHLLIRTQLDVKQLSVTAQLALTEQLEQMSSIL